MKRQEGNSAQPDFIVTCCGPGVLVWSRSFYFSYFLKHNTILKKKGFLIKILCQVHNNLRNVYIEIFLQNILAFFFFIRMGVADSDNVPDLKSRETD